MSDELKPLNPHVASGKITRRQFGEKIAAGAAAAAGLMIIKPELVRGTAANSRVSIGLLGCGGRGTHDATVLSDSPSARVVALADLFQDQLDKAKSHFGQIAQQKGYTGVEDKRIFRGPEAYQQIANSKDVDAVVITTPPYFHHQHLAAVVDAGKHAYCEKPVSVDVNGAKHVIEIGKKAEGRLSLDVGFELRMAPPYVELTKRVQAGALGRIACGEAYYYSTFIDRPSWPNESPDYVRLRNWIYDRTLSGDIVVEQNIHVIDMFNWMLNARPLKATATGGRQVRTDSGNVYGHYNVTYTYPNDVTINFGSTQFDKGWWDVAGRFFGSKGVSEWHYSGPVAIYGDEPWKWNAGPNSSEGSGGKGQFSVTGAFTDNLAQADPQKLGGFIDSIVSGKFHNQAALGAESTLSAMLAREAAYLGRELSWDELNGMDMTWDSGIDLKQFS
ncbi:MAG TPA: Gfo/Idh/MocA family oxidoreductase [Terriglobia bacterium]|nr:Gfo/Idh/MocA family oxidoreductase [Terriglobia bacterium]